MTVALLGAGGGGAALLVLIKGLVEWLSGSASRERAKNTDLAGQRRKAVEDRIHTEQQRDAADRKRREAEEHVSLLKRQLIMNGLVPVERTDDNT